VRDLDERRQAIDARFPVVDVKEQKELQIELIQIKAKRTRLMDGRKNMGRPWSKKWAVLSQDEKDRIESIISMEE